MQHISRGHGGDGIPATWSIAFCQTVYKKKRVAKRREPVMLVVGCVAMSLIAGFESCEGVEVTPYHLMGSPKKRVVE